MDTTKVIVALCGIIDQMNAIIQDQAVALAQLGAVCREEEIVAARRDYAAAIGEVPQ